MRRGFQDLGRYWEFQPVRLLVRQRPERLHQDRGMAGRVLSFGEHLSVRRLVYRPASLRLEPHSDARRQRLHYAVLPEGNERCELAPCRPGRYYSTSHGLPQLLFGTRHLHYTGPLAISVGSYSDACAPSGTCIPQQGTTQQLDSLGDRLMFRLAYRNFGSHESLVASHSVASGSSTGVRWYEIQSPNATPTIFQSGTFAPDSKSRWMPSIAMDKAGDIALGYSISSSNMFPSIVYTGRLPGDALGTMESETTIFAGLGSQTSGLSRWGDYTSMSVDPSNDCTFWYANEYLPASGSFNWNTRLASFTFPSCVSTAPDFTLS